MLVIVFRGKTFTHTNSGSAPRAVICEQCNCKYFYQLTRTTRSSTNSPFRMLDERAQQVAEERAKESLKTALESDIDPVACPKCGWVQEDMVRAMKDNKSMAMVWATLGLTVVIGIIGRFVWTESRDSSSVERIHEVIAWTAAAAGFASIAAILTHVVQVIMIQPNEGYPDRPSKPLLGPPALKIRESDRISTTLIPARFAPPEIKNGWIALQVTNWGPPDCCMMCLSDDVFGGFDYPLRFRPSMPMPICKRCYHGFQLKWWLIVLGISVAIYFAIYRIAASTEMDLFELSMFVGLIGTFASAMISPFTASLLLKPFRVRSINFRSGWSRFRFRNSGFTELIRGQLARPDEHIFRVATKALRAQVQRLGKQDAAASAAAGG
jgi:hypothetical protein